MKDAQDEEEKTKAEEEAKKSEEEEDDEDKDDDEEEEKKEEEAAESQVNILQFFFLYSYIIFMNLFERFFSSFRITTSCKRSRE